MERRSTESRAHTIRAKIWMMVILLAVTNCVCGSLTFVAGSFIFAEAWISVLLSIGTSTLTTIAFAWWISSDILKPLDKLNLLAKSIERSPGMSVPQTTGAVETDDLLHTISRASKQLTNFVDLMDEVTAGNTQAALDPLEHSDRLSQSFQKLVAKVTDSIDAKAELSKLQAAVQQLSNEVAGIQHGSPVRIRTDLPATRQITDALQHLLDKQAETVKVLGPSTSDISSLAGESRNRISAALERDEARSRVLKKLGSGVQDINAEWEAHMHRLATSLHPVNGLAEELDAEPASIEERTKTITAVKKQFESAISKLRDVGEQSLAITHVAKSVQDLARRSNMIAMNTSIQACTESAVGLSTLTQEITSLSERAEKANKAIAGISDSVVRDVTAANASIQWLLTEVNKIATGSARAEESVERMKRVLNDLAALPAQIETTVAEQQVAAARNTDLLQDCISRSEEIAAELRSCEAGFVMLNEPLTSLRGLCSDRSTGVEVTNGAVKANGSRPRQIVTLTGEK